MSRSRTLFAPVSVRLAIASMAALAVAIFGAWGVSATPAAAQPAPTPIKEAALEWGINQFHQYGAFAGGCDFFSAGISDGARESYRSQEDSVYIIKRIDDAGYVQASFDNRCQPLADDGSNGQRMLFTDGTGERSADGTVSVSWTGAVTVTAYGGLVPWYIKDPILNLDSEGNGSVIADVGGYSSSMDNPDVKEPLAPIRDVEIATIRAAANDPTGFTITPVFAGVDYYPLTDPMDLNSPRKKESAIGAEVKAKNPAWGSFPTPLVDFQYQTGLSSYWHTSGLSADPKKPPMPLTVSYDFGSPRFVPNFSERPMSQVVSEGVDVTFTATADGVPPEEIRWQRLEGKKWVEVSGAKGSYKLPSVTVADHNGLQVRAVATNENGTNVAPATLTVEKREAPKITKQPESLTAQASASASFAVEATGSALQYRWERSEDEGATWAELDAQYTADQSYLYIQEAELADDGVLFRVIVTNGFDAPVASDPARFTVTSAPTEIVEQPQGGTILEGSRMWLSMVGSGAPYPTWQWERSTDGGNSWTDFGRPEVTDGVVSQEIPSVGMEFNGNKFRVRGDNGIGDPVVSQEMTLTVLEKQGRSLWVTEPDVIQPGQANEMVIQASGFERPLDIKQYSATLAFDVVERGTFPDGKRALAEGEYVARGEVQVSDDGNLDLSISVPAGALDSNKAYSVIVYRLDDPTDRRFDFESPILLAGQEAPAVTEAPTSVQVALGEPATFKVVGSGAPSLDYQWQLLAPDGNWNDVPGAVKDTLTVTNTERSRNGQQFRAVLSNQFGTAASQPAVLTIGFAPVVEGPSSVTVQAGQKATLTANVTASPKATLQWQVKPNRGDWSDIVKATGDTYSFVAKPADSGSQFRVVAKNEYGAQTSEAATLAVTSLEHKPRVEVSQVKFSSTGAQRVTVAGTGFDPSLAIAKYPRAGQESGIYVAFGAFAAKWQPSKDAPPEARPAASGVWVMPNEDGSFQAEITIDKGAADDAASEPGYYGVYTYPAAGAWQPGFEIATEVTFTDTAP